MNIYLKVGLVLLIGFIFGKIAHKLKFPSVSGYLIAGLFLGQSVFGVINAQESMTLEWISEITLSFIAFGIGSEMILKDLASMGKKIMIITIAEVVGALVVVFSVMYFIFNHDLAFSLVIASMSAATAPAATIMVIRQYQSFGPVTKTILPVVALDDVFGIMAFGIALSIAKLLTSTQSISIFTMITAPLIEIVGSILLGIMMGIILVLVTKRLDPKDELQIKTILFIAIGIGVAEFLHLSPLLVNIAMGSTIANLRSYSNRTFSALNDFVPVFYVLFFTLAGASLNLNVLYQVGWIGAGYIVARASGKIFGAMIGARVAKAEPTVQKYLGFALLPQGGISIGLSVIVMQQLPMYSLELTTIIMASVLFYETLGPLFAKISIQSAKELYQAIPGEIEPI